MIFLWRNEWIVWAPSEVHSPENPSTIIRGIKSQHPVESVLLFTPTAWSTEHLSVFCPAKEWNYFNLLLHFFTQHTFNLIIQLKKRIEITINVTYLHFSQWTYCSNGARLRRASTSPRVLLAQYGATTSASTGQALNKSITINTFLSQMFKIKYLIGGNYSQIY